MRPRASVIVVGNEVLNGSTLDTNSHHACRQVAARGGSVSRIAVVPDDLEVIASELRAQLAQSPALIVTFGGLGPTVDDLTAQAVAAALGVPLAEDAVALEMVADRYAALEREGVVGPARTEASREARTKMARLPAGSIPVANPVGAAPAILVEHAGTSVLSLPGVPREAAGILDGEGKAVLDRAIGAGHFATVTVLTSTNDESVLAGVAGDLTRRFPGTYVKTRLIGGSSRRIGISLSAGGAREDAVRAELHRALADLEEALAGEGLSVVAVSEE